MAWRETCSRCCPIGGAYWSIDDLLQGSRRKAKTPRGSTCPKLHRMVGERGRLCRTSQQREQCSVRARVRDAASSLTAVLRCDGWSSLDSLNRWFVVDVDSATGRHGHSSGIHQSGPANGLGDQRSAMRANLESATSSSMAFCRRAAGVLGTERNGRECRVAPWQRPHCSSTLAV